ncbi:MAG TPA: GNAT family N-acetyltransferase [Bryobacteraceae bacterium]
MVNSPGGLELTDGLILLRPLRADDAAHHLAGEDDEIARWLSGGRSTLRNVQDYITRCQASWRSNGPLRAFGVFDCRSGRLIGSVEANLAYVLESDQVNVSCGVFPEWRGRGVALRALDLMGEYLAAATDVRQMILRIAPENTKSVKLAVKAGCVFLGVFDEANGTFARYARDVK